MWGPALAALTVRLSLYLAGAGWAVTQADLATQHDAAEYHVLARSLADGQGFAFDPDDPLFAGRRMRWDVEALRTPGYPLFVAAVYAAGGPHPGIPVGLQLLFEAGTCLLLAWTLRGTLGPRRAGFAALVYALHPGAALLANVLYSESLFTLLAVAGAGLLSAAGSRGDGENGRRALIGIAGALIGLAALVRPVVTFLPIPIAAYLAATGGQGWTRGLTRAAVFSLAFALVLLPWVARNHVRHGHVALSTSAAFNSLALYAVPAEGEATGRPEDELLDAHLARADRAARASGIVDSDFDRARHWRAEARRVISAYPGAFLRVQAIGVARLFVSTGRRYRPFVLDGVAELPPAGANVSMLARWWTSQPVSYRVLDLWWLLYGAVVYPLLVIGIVSVCRRRREERQATLGLLAVVALYLVVMTGTPGHSRFMAPIVPFLAPFAAVGAVPVRRAR